MLRRVTVLSQADGGKNVVVVDVLEVEVVAGVTPQVALFCSITPENVSLNWLR